jgi:heme/copper-type cytochrome/quinol oxidase subunit 4
MSRRAWYLLVGVAFAVHNSEEAFAAGRLLTFMQSYAPAFVRGFYAGITIAELQINLIILTALGFAVSMAAASSRGSSASVFAMLVLAAVLALNALLHVGFSIGTRSYMPGVMTALLITLPLSLLLLVKARREAWLPTSAFWAVVPAAVFVHGPVLAVFLRISLLLLRMRMQ